MTKDWIRKSTTNCINTYSEYGDYGYGWWIKTYKRIYFYRALGTGGQQILICPKEKIAIILIADIKTFDHYKSEALSNKIIDTIAL